MGIINFLKRIWRWIIRKDSQTQNLPPDYVPPEITPNPPPKKQEEHSTAWAGGKLDERRAMYALALRVCKEEGLTPKMTKDLLLTIAGESGFNQWCVNHNKNGTTDWGLCQFNDGKNEKGVPYWIGPGADFSSPEEVLNNPEKCVRVMCREFKKGNQKYWLAYNFRERYESMLNLLS